MRRYNKLIWGAGGVLFLLPVIAMQMHLGGMNWSPFDFIVFGAMILLACGSYEMASRHAGNFSYLAGLAVAILNAFVIIWANLAVGIIGNESNPANLMFDAIVALVFVAGLILRRKPAALARVMLAAALAYVLAILVSHFAGWGTAPRVALPFGALWLVSALLFRRASRG